MENKGEMLQPSLIFTILSRRESLIERGGGGNLLQNLTTNKEGGLYRGVGGGVFRELFWYFWVFAAIIINNY